MSSSTQLNSSSSPEVATMESISTAMKAIERKREDLHKAFQMVQSHSQTLTLFNLNWTDLDQYFNSIQQTLESRFKELESKEQNLQNHNKPIPKSTPKTPQSQQTQTLIKHPELKTFCEKMDGKGLCVYIMTNRNDLQAIKTEALSAFKSVGDPSKLVVDALKSFNGKEMKKGDRMNEFGSFRRSCVLLLEALSLSKPEIKPSVREEAKKVAFEWKKNKGKDVQLENISFLLLVATFGLVSEFSTNELLDMLVAIARCKQSIELFQALGFSDQIHVMAKVCEVFMCYEPKLELLEMLGSVGYEIMPEKFFVNYLALKSYFEHTFPLMKSTGIVGDELTLSYTSIYSEVEDVCKLETEEVLKDVFNILCRNGILAEKEDEVVIVDEEKYFDFSDDETYWVIPEISNHLGVNEFGDFRRSCVLLLEALSLSKPKIKPSVREEAKRVAFQWKKNKGKDVQLENISFLLLVVTFGLVSEFSTNELLDMLVAIARCKQSIELFRALGFSDQIHDFIRKLNCGRMQLVALKFVFAFNIADKFPPVPLLEDYLKDCKEAVEEVHKKGNNSLQSQNEAIAKEISFLTTMVKSIEEHKLESQYPRESLDKRIAQLEKEKVDRKHYAKSPATVKQQQPQQSGKKHPQPLATNTPVVSNPLQQMGLLPDPVAARYLPVLTQQGVTGPSPSASHYGLVSASQYGMQGPSPSASQYGLPGPSLSASQYGIQGPSPVSQYGVVAPNQSMPNLYSSETQMASDLYGRTLGYGGYGTQASFGQLPYFYGAQ
ncbi:hypothetical protein GIB67_013391 [Kingdonia uniflora]|uniref:FRIGIDA-like protein n=1 Tax=Kingdonia uniflora TaxID=39325 RepID=A0A7J7LR60_9MAGN|nr:hypothetical protein GIB67_013391 [Kingdonia uniflora]